MERRVTERDLHEHRRDEEKAGLHEHQGKDAEQAEEHGALLQHPHVEQRLFAAPEHMPLPEPEGDQEERADDDERDHRRDAALGSELMPEGHHGFAGGQPAVPARLQHAEHDDRQPQRLERGAHAVERHPGARDLGHPDARREEQRDDDDADLHGKRVAPAREGREKAAHQRPQRGAHGGHGAHRGKGGDTHFAGRERGTDDRVDGGDHESGAEALEQRPAEHHHRQAAAQRRDQGAAAVHGDAEQEHGAASPDVAELAADQHEGGHDQRVEHERRLHARHGRAQTLHDRRHGDVHGRGVVGVDELRHAQCHEDELQRQRRCAGGQGRARSSACARGPARACG